MKNFKVHVDDAKASFFRELMESFAFVKYEEVDGFHEPRVYPGGNFEIRSQPAGSSKPPKDITTLPNDEAMKNIRTAIKAIEVLRERNRNA